jgi:hypothetical protein
MISIRVSEDEYSSFKDLCSMTGARSVSDLARYAMSALLNGFRRRDALSISVDEFRAQVRRLDRKIEELEAGITSPKNESNAE